MPQENIAEKSESPDASENLETLKAEYRDRVKASKLGKKEKRACLEWVSGEDVKTEDIRKMLRHFTKAEDTSVQLVRMYEERIDDLIARGLFSKNPERKQKYTNWFADLPYNDELEPMDKIRALNQPFYKIKEREAVLQQWLHIPAAVRKNEQHRYEQNGIEENLRMIPALLKRHKTLKRRFLALPENLQEANREIFKNNGSFDEREIMLVKLEEDALRNKKQDRSAAEATGGKKPVEASEKQEPENRKNPSAAKAWLLKLLRIFSLSSRGSGQKAETIETFAIAREAARRRRFAELTSRARETEALTDESAKNDPFAQNVEIKMRDLRYERQKRQILKHRLKAGIDDTDAQAAKVEFFGDGGKQMTTQEFIATELPRQGERVKDMLVTETSKSAIAKFDAEILKEAASRITDRELFEATKETIRKAA